MILRLLAGVLLTGTLAAQIQPPPRTTIDLPLVLDSGRHAADPGASGPQVVLSFPVHVAGATSLRIFFSELELAGDLRRGNHSILRLTSWQDGAVQELDPVEALQWELSSAYFNGDTVQVEVLAYPEAGPNHVVTQRVEAGWPPKIQFSQCGGTDDRMLSNDPRVARVIPVECTAWMVDDCNHCFVTAGHCSPSANIAEFNVPLSNPNGTLNHPSPDHQYMRDPASVQAVNGGIGNDWAVFGVFPNSNTGLTPAQAQGSWFTLAPQAPPFDPNDMIRITGHGSDSTPQTHHKVQQTHVGPWFDLTGNDVEYQVDTTGGNSGSPVIHEDSGQAIGVHTHGGCSGVSGNHGTNSANAGWTAARTNPQGVCAQPCNDVTIYCTAKVNSQGCTPQIAAVGQPSIAGGAGQFLLSAAMVLNQKSGLLFYGFGAANLPFQGGTLCVQAPLRRTPSQSSGGNSLPPSDCSGTLTFDFGALLASGADPLLTVGQNVNCQFYYRDPQSPVAAVGLTNAAQFTVEP